MSAFMILLKISMKDVAIKYNKIVNDMNLQLINRGSHKRDPA